MTDQNQTVSFNFGRNVLLATLVAVGMGHTVLFAVLAPLGREIGLTEIQIGSIISASSITVFLCTPIWGRISDRWGRKKVMLIGLFGYSLGTILFTTICHSALIGFLAPLPAYIALIVSRMMHASVMSATMPASSAYMADITNAATRTKGMGAVGAANNIGAILGPALGAGLAIYSLLAPLWFAGIFTLVVGFVVYFLLPDAPKQIVTKTPKKLRRTDPRIFSFFVMGVMMFMGFSIVQQTMAFRLQDSLGLTGAETANMFGIGMMMSAAASLFSQAVVVQRFDVKPFTLLRMAIPLLILAFLIMANFATRDYLMGSMILMGLGMGLAGPGYMAGASLAVGPEEQGAVAGVAGSAGPLGFTIGPLVGSVLYSIQPEYPYVFALVVYIPLFIFAMMSKTGSK
ncbi:MAG: MFS family permease [Candidatus Azotimanducaceae bacterium]|jgi:MFS family permease